MKIHDSGKEHTTGNPNCPACYQGDWQGHWPRPHNKDGCTKLLHAEMDADINTPNVVGSMMKFVCDACGPTLY
jgi:hypothetical protein